MVNWQATLAAVSFKFTSTKRVLLWLIMATIGVIALIFVSGITEIQPFGGAHRRDGRSVVEKSWTWKCEEDRCVRHEWPNSSTPWSSLDTCRVMCNQTPLLLWPKPTEIVFLSKRIVSFNLNQLYMDVPRSIARRTKYLLRDALNLFKANLLALVPDAEIDCPHGPSDVIINLAVRLENEADVQLTLNTTESYTLHIKNNTDNRTTVLIDAHSFFGARHALETLSQLMWWETNELGVGTFKVVNEAYIKDRPAFQYRGIMIDTARNFIPISSLQSTIIGMAASKLNTLHLHLTDSHSFSFESTRFPLMSHYGAYSPEKVYSARDLKKLAEFALVRGVRLVPEVDAPAHAAAGWQWGEEENLGQLAVCVNQQPWSQYCGEPPCGQLNPSNNNTYRVLRGIYQDLIETMKTTDLFHMGGDEVNMKCWADSPGVYTDEEQLNPIKSFTGKVIEFHQRAIRELQEANNGTSMKNVVVWSTQGMKQDFLLRAFPPKQYIIQEWDSSSHTMQHLKLNYRVIISHVNAWYLDCGFGTWKFHYNEPCSPVSIWQTVYAYRPWSSYRPHLKQVLGGEVCLWTEMIDENTVDSRVWPRAAALAERLWSDPREGWVRGQQVTQDMIMKDAVLRLSVFRERLVKRGVKADALWPQWCTDNPEGCF